MTGAREGLALPPNARIRFIHRVREGHYMQNAPLFAVALLTALTQPRPRHARVIIYDCEPRTTAGRVDVDRILHSVVHVGASGYDYLIWHASTDWEDLGLYLSSADSAGITSWVTITPPTEQRPPNALTAPFDTDYIAWQGAISSLARVHQHLEALVLDDFDYNTRSFPLPLLSRMKGLRTELGGRPALYGVIYRHTLDSLRSWWSSRDSVLDGVVYAYDDFSSTDSLARILALARRQLPLRAALVVNVYATGGYKAKTPRRTPEYLASALMQADTIADVVRLYCMPKDQADPLVAVVQSFTQWTATH